MPIVSTVHACQKDQPSCPMESAFWLRDSMQMVYGRGFIADDVAAHELTHGVTQFESHLFNYYQSGAINESLSDTWGEWVDQTNDKGDDGASVRWELGEDLPDGTQRDMSDPPLYDSPARMTSPLYSGSPSDHGGIHTNNGVGNKAAFLITDGGFFNGHLVIGLGLDKASQIYYKTQTDLLHSGSDYRDLGSGLINACGSLKGLDLEGTPAKITATDCLQVKEAVAATEMMKQPLVAKAPEAPMCDPGTTRVKPSIFYDGMENTESTNWKVVPDTWFYSTDNATNGTHALHAKDPATKADFFLQKKLPVKIPDGTKTFLRFDHAYLFDSSVGYADGGLLEFRLPGGSWEDAGPKFTNGSGYDGTLASNVGNPLGGHKAFVGSSHGYRSSRVNLSSLAGNQVDFRFRMVTNSVNGNRYGWYLDNLSVYTCK
jgi:bacillolysin